MQRPQRLNKGTRMAGFIKSIKALSDDDGENVPKKNKGKRKANDSTDPLQGDEDDRNPMAPPLKKQKPIPNPKVHLSASDLGDECLISTVFVASSKGPTFGCAAASACQSVSTPPVPVDQPSFSP